MSDDRREESLKKGEPMLSPERRNEKAMRHVAKLLEVMQMRLEAIAHEIERRER